MVKFEGSEVVCEGVAEWLCKLPVTPRASSQPLLVVIGGIWGWEGGLVKMDQLEEWGWIRD